MVINLKAANTSLFSKFFLNNMILILFWGPNLNSVLIFHHIESSRHLTQFSDKKSRNAFGGGGFQAIKSDLASIEDVDDCEVLWSSLRIANRKTIYISPFFTPPNSSTEILDHLSDSLKNVFSRVPIHRNIIMASYLDLGDIDCNRISA